MINQIHDCACLPSFSHSCLPLLTFISGKSDPYVRMGVIHKRHLDDRIVQRDYLTAWWKEKILISDLQNTDVIKKTLTPEWNEQKELYVKFVQHMFYVWS